MRLSELIYRDSIKVGLEATNKWEAIEELVDHLVSARELRLADRHDVLEALFERERSLSTGLEHGLAVPHGRTTCVDEIITALGTSQEGIPFESLDGKPAHCIVLLVLPKASFQGYVHTLSGIASLGANAGLRDEIYQATTAEQIVKLIQDADEAQASSEQ